MWLTRRRLGGALIALVVVALPVGYAAHRQNRLRNFGAVTDAVLYRSGQLTRVGLERVVREHRIRTVVTLRPVRGAGANPDTWEEDVCREHGVRHVRVSPREETGEAGLDAMARGFLAVMDDPANHPVLVHCLAGRDRTGAMCAVYRMEYDRWDPERAAAEMREYEFDPARDAAARAYERYVLTYRPRWQRARGGPAAAAATATPPNRVTGGGPSPRTGANSRRVSTAAGA